MKLHSIGKSICVLFLIMGYVGISQTQPSIKTEVSTHKIKIGEQIKYKIEVGVSLPEKVIFPSQTAFSPLEMVDQTPVDTLKKNGKSFLQKTYFLTQFNKGNYYIPVQTLQVGNKFFKTDSLLVEVRSVAVDTLKQPLYDIKPIIEVEKSLSYQWLWWVLIGIGIIGVGAGVVYVVFFRKKPLSEAEKFALLPPFDRALVSLKDLEKSRYLLESDYKGYYSDLTYIVRKYLEEEVRINATESTTDELILRLEGLLQEKKLNLSVDVVNDLKSVLQKADLVKFAKNMPDDFQANADLKSIESVVVKTNEALPESEWEQQRQSQAFHLEQQAQRKRKQRKLAVLIGGGIALIGIMAVGVYYTYYYMVVKNTSLEYLSQKQWVTSVYGTPSLQITTPLAMERVEKSPIYPDAKSVFFMGNRDAFSFEYVVYELKNQNENSSEEVTYQMGNKAIALAKRTVEMGHKGKNIIYTTEEYTSPKGWKGLKLSGSFDKEIEKGTLQKMKLNHFIFSAQGHLVFFLFISPESTQESDVLVMDRILISLENMPQGLESK